MNIFLRRLAVLLTVFASVGAQARNLTLEQKLADFRFFTSVIDSAYGPLEYKTFEQRIPLAELNSRFDKEIASTTANMDFYYKLVDYVANYHDGHFNIRLPANNQAIVPVVTDLVDGKVLITEIDRSKIKEDKFPFAVGDEIVTAEGKPVSDYLDSASHYIASGNPRSVRRFASWTLFNRQAQRILVPGAKSIKLTIRRGTSKLVEPAELEWTFKTTDPDESSAPIKPAWFFPKASNMNFDMLDNMSAREWVHPSSDSNYMCSGNTRIHIPDDATTIMKSPFVAYYHPTAKGNVGYLRIPHYYPKPKAGQSDTDATQTWISQYEFAIRELEKNTVGLIIDQDHNCGGSVWVVNKMISMFVDHAFEPSQFQLLANKETYLEVQRWMNSQPEFTVDRENINRVLKVVEDAWLRGESRLTPKTSIDGQQLFPPDSVQYTKPIVMLIDEVAGSGGDMFPAMMKGLGRAKLFGQTTSGLGGHVQMYPAALPNSQLTFRITKSLFYRPDGVAVENNGAVPDRFYTITRDDFLYGFKGYQQEYLDYLLSLLP